MYLVLMYVKMCGQCINSVRNYEDHTIHYHSATVLIVLI